MCSGSRFTRDDRAFALGLAELIGVDVAFSSAGCAVVVVVFFRAVVPDVFALVPEFVGVEDFVSAILILYRVRLFLYKLPQTKL